MLMSENMFMQMLKKKKESANNDDDFDLPEGGIKFERQEKVVTEKEVNKKKNRKFI